MIDNWLVMLLWDSDNLRCRVQIRHYLLLRVTTSYHVRPGQKLVSMLASRQKRAFWLLILLLHVLLIKLIELFMADNEFGGILEGTISVLLRLLFFSCQQAVLNY